MIVERPERIAPLEQVLHVRERKRWPLQYDEIRLEKGTVIHVCPDARVNSQFTGKSEMIDKPRQREMRCDRSGRAIANETSRTRFPGNIRSL